MRTSACGTRARPRPGSGQQHNRGAGLLIVVVAATKGGTAARSVAADFGLPARPTGRARVPLLR